jgi:hypothetical protein
MMSQRFSPNQLFRTTSARSVWKIDTDVILGTYLSITHGHVYC